MYNTKQNPTDSYFLGVRKRRIVTYTKVLNIFDGLEQETFLGPQSTSLEITGTMIV